MTITGCKISKKSFYKEKDFYIDYHYGHDNITSEKKCTFANLFQDRRAFYIILTFKQLYTIQI